MSELQGPDGHGSVCIRQATREDVDGIAGLYRAEAEYHGELDSAMRLRTSFDWSAAVSGLLEARDRRVFVAANGADLIGFIHVRVLRPRGTRPLGLVAKLRRRLTRWRSPAPSLAEAIGRPTFGVVEDCYVKPGCRQSGLGAQLVEAGARWMLEAGAEYVELNVEAGNHGAVAFWEACGFTARQHRMRWQPNPPR